jgi:NADH-quinone oxidoreductase subunit A
MFIGVFVAVLGSVFGPHRPTQRKGRPYESGMIPYGEGTRRVSIRYYIVAMLFILFDIELVFFLPWALVFRKLGWFGVIEMVIFLGILLVGYIFAWKKGALEWD